MTAADRYTSLQSKNLGHKGRTKELKFLRSKNFNLRGPYRTVCGLILDDLYLLNLFLWLRQTATQACSQKTSISTAYQTESYIKTDFDWIIISSQFGLEVTSRTGVREVAGSSPIAGYFAIAIFLFINWRQS